MTRTRYSEMNLEDSSYLRKHSYETRNTRQLQIQKCNLESLCKPVSINIIKLSISELNKLHNTCPHEVERKDALPQKRKSKSKKGKKRPKRKTNKRKQRSNLSNSKSNNNKSDTTNVLRNIKQPCIKLHKIDEVINKIAYSLTKAVSKNSCQTSVHTEDTETAKTEINASELNASELNASELNASELNASELNASELNGSELNASELNASESQALELSPLSTNVDESLTNENEKTTTQVRNSQEKSSESSECFVNRNSERKDSITYFSNSDSVSVSNDNNSSHEIIISEEKILISDENTIDVCEPNDDCNIIDTKCINKDLILQVEPCQDLNTSYTLCDTSENVCLKQESLDVEENIEEGNKLTHVPSEFNLEDDIPLKVEENITIVEEPILLSKDIQEEVVKVFTSDEDLIQKYKLFKDLKVFLITLDNIKNYTTRYSAVEIEQLTEMYLDFLIDSNCINASQHSMLFNRKKSQKRIEELVVENLSNPVPLEDATAEPEEFNTFNETNTNTSSSNICEKPDENVCVDINKTQDVIDPNKSSSDTNEKIQQEEDLETERIHHNLSQYWLNFKQSSFDEIPEQSISVDCSKQKSMVSSHNVESMVSSCTPKSMDKNSMITPNLKSSTEERISKSSPHKKSRKLVIDTRSQRKVVNTSRIVTSKSLLSNAKQYVSTPKEKILIGKTYEKFVSMNSIELNTKEDPTAHYPSIITPQKRNKYTDKKDKKTTFYKCIICDHYYKNYSDLQSHLITHTQKVNSTLTSPSKDLNTSAEKVKQVSSSHDSNKSKNVTPIDIMNKKRKRKKCNLASVCDDSNKCSMCSKLFLSRSDLAAHIFLHTESELQKVYEMKKQKMKVDREMEKVESKHIKVAKTDTDRNNSVNKTPKKRKLSESLIEGNPKLRIVESTVSDKNHSKGEQLYVETPTDAEKLNKETSGKRSFKICKCHNTPGISDNCLQIEIALLCHTCRILFRTMKCFETHYRLPEHATCNQNRIRSGRSPNLFCTTCGMIFSSVQDVRHHLELHARFKQNATLDFRCNICKVIFIGIGTLFYIHWSKHVKNPFWMASELTFPKHTIVSSILKKADIYYMDHKQNVTTVNDSVKDYIHIAEYICQKCKMFFLTADDLKNHELRCCKSNSADDATTTEDSNVQNNLPIKIICSVCDNTFITETEFYQHIREKHNFKDEFQFICKSISSTKKIYICNICMDATENLDKLKEHWLQHYVTNVYFNCTRCAKKYSNNLNFFIEHTKEHETEVRDVPSCTVTYQDAKFICKYCNIGFGSLESLNTHNDTHKQTCSSGNSERDNILDHEKSATASNVNHASSTVKSKEPIIERQQEKLLSKSKESVIEEKQQETFTNLKKPTTLKKLKSLTKSDGTTVEIQQKVPLIKPQESSIAKGQEKSPTKSKKASIEGQGECLTQSKKSSIGRQEEGSSIMQKESVVQRQQEEFLTNSKEANTETQQGKQKKSSIIPRELTIEKQLEQSLLKAEEITSDIDEDESLLARLEIVEEMKKQSSTGTNNKEDLIRILEGNDDSDSELIIDLIELSEEDNNSHKGECDKNQAASDINNIQTITPNTEESMSSKIPKQSTITDVENVQNTKVYDNVSEINTKDSLPPKEPSPKKVNRGFIRVKTLAELTGALLCHVCGLSIHGSDNIIKHRDICSKESNASATSMISNQPTVIAEKPNNSVESRTACDKSVLPQTNSNTLYQRVSLDKAKMMASRVLSQNQQQPNAAQNQQVNKPQDPKKLKPLVNSAHHKNLPHCNAVQNISKLRKVRITNKHLSFFNKEICTDGAAYKHVCKFCGFYTNNVSECLLHELPGSQYFCKKQIIKNVKVTQISNTNTTQNKGHKQSILIQPTTTNTSVYYQYPYIASSSSNNTNEINIQNQSTIANQSMGGTTSTPVYYKNPSISSGGMSIVINQTAPVTQNIPTLGILQQPMQQPIYQPQFYTESVPVVNNSYVQQPQNVVGYLRSNGVYEISNNQYNTTHTGGIGSGYKVMLQPSTVNCPHCPNATSFVNEEMLQIHLNTAHNFKCNVCGLRLYNFSEWNIHKDMHTSI